MKTEDRQRLFDELMKGALDVCRGNPHELVLFEQSTNADLDCIEPIIDRIIAERVRAGAARPIWQELDFAIDSVLADGPTCIVEGRYQEKQFAVTIERSRLRDFGQYLMLEAAK